MPWHEETSVAIAFSGSVESMKYALMNGCPWYERAIISGEAIIAKKENCLFIKAKKNQIGKEKIELNADRPKETKEEREKEIKTPRDLIGVKSEKVNYA